MNRGTARGDDEGCDGGRRPGEDAVVAEFLDLYAADLAGGVVRRRGEYEALFAGFEDAVGRRFDQIQGRAGLAPSEAERIGAFRVVKELGRGGQAIVYLAEDDRLGRHVALKVIREVGGLSPDVFARFKREAEIASRLDHSGICPVYDAGQSGSIAWIAMRYVEGEPLARVLRAERGPAGSERIGSLLVIFERIARALHAAHEAGIVHRDVKPADIMIGAAGEPVLLDFGLARELRADGVGDGLTRTGDVLGTPAYLSPEQLDQGRGPVDCRTDVWALGVSLYESVTGSRPFDAPTRAGLARAILDDEPLDPRRLNGAIGSDLCAVLGAALEKDLRRRYQRASDLADDLARLRARQPVRARPASAWVRLQRFCEREPLVAGSLALVFVVLVAGLGGTLAVLNAVRQERDAKAAAVEAYDQMADVVTVADLLASADDLWPRRPEKLAAMRSWIASARDVLRRRDVHANLLAGIDSTAPGEPPDAKVRWRRNVLRGLIADLARVKSMLADVEQREQVATDIVRATVESHRDDWKRCIESVAAESGAAQLQLEPRAGLVPLGRDPQSGRWEFWLSDSGAEPARTAAGGPLRMEENAGLVMVLLPGGTFTMGAQREDPDAPAFDGGARVDEIVATGTLEPFFISKFEMTQGQWLRIAGANPSTYSPSRALYGQPATLAHPVEQVDYATARNVLRRLDLTLPTEAQWEYACRAGTTTSWSTGTDVRGLEGFANLADSSFARAQSGSPAGEVETWLADGFPGHAPVGSLGPNAFGLYDMHGNVLEWCLDAYSAAPRAPRPGDGLRDGSDGVTGVARGGSFYTSAAVARSAARFAPRRSNAAIYLGLRPVMAVRLGH